MVGAGLGTSGGADATRPEEASVRLVTTAATLLLVLPLAACSTGSEPAAEPPATSPSTSTPTGTTPSGTPSAAPSAEPESDDDLPPVRDRVSLAALMREDVRGGPIRRTAALAETGNWRSWAVTYTVNGAAGFVVLHTDYRGPAGSDPVADLDHESRLVYTRDAIGAVEALTREPYVDDNLRQFTEPNRPDGASALYARHGTPEQRPGFYRGLSSRTYFDRIEVPVLIHHGTLDDTCPPAWSRETHRLMRRAGVDSTLVEWPGEGHAFGPRFADSMRRTVAFLRAELGV